MRKCPCYKCNDRNIECHDECKNYKTWREEHLQQKAMIDENRVIYMDATRSQVESVGRNKK